MSVNTTYEALNKVVTKGEIDAGRVVFNLTWEYNPDVSNLRLFVGEEPSELDASYDSSDNTVTVTLDDTVAEGASIILRRRTPITQDEDFSSGQFVPENALETSLDKLVYIAQELNSG